MWPRAAVWRPITSTYIATKHLIFKLQGFLKVFEFDPCQHPSYSWSRDQHNHEVWRTTPESSSKECVDIIHSFSVNILQDMEIIISIIVQGKNQQHTVYTGCPRRNVPDFGRVFLMLKYTDITQNTCVQSWTVTEIMAREVWNFDSCYTLIDYQIHIKTGRNMWFL